MWRERAGGREGCKPGEFYVEGGGCEYILYLFILEFTFTPREHVAIGEDLGIFDFRSVSYLAVVLQMFSVRK